ncbi:MAG: tyrosine-type recombinase/integrase, partial [Cyanobacteria bacterium HKST-UBA04]|nr:tyrosine-type recombinase/integrase [Cyanobacteria bacterium HKST-UBA04]
NVGDVDLANGVLMVEQGKGGKRRKVGMNQTLLAHMKRYICTLSDTHESAPLFLNTKGLRMQRDGLLNRIRRLGKQTGIKVSPHVLRRAFVTINANKGRSLVMLQMACGHSDIKTTRDYCKTTEDEVIQAMKGW